MSVLAISVPILSLIASRPANPAARAPASVAGIVLPSADRDYAKMLEALNEHVPGSITPEADARVLEAVEETIRKRDLGKEGTLAQINALEADHGECPFVLDPRAKAVVAHGSLPDRVGKEIAIIGDGSDAPADLLFSKLLESGGGVSTWLEYLLFDVSPGTDQLKRSRLVLHDGLVFGTYSTPHNAQRVPTHAKAVLSVHCAFTRVISSLSSSMVASRLSISTDSRTISSRHAAGWVTVWRPKSRDK